LLASVTRSPVKHDSFIMKNKIHKPYPLTHTKCAHIGHLLFVFTITCTHIQ
jgi:hypothetical protein